MYVILISNNYYIKKIIFEEIYLEIFVTNDFLVCSEGQLL